MAILVTGGAGFIGSHLLDHLGRSGERPVCLDNFNDYYSPRVKRENIAELVAKGAVTLYDGDILDAALCRRIFEQHKVDVVAHLAARAGVRASLEAPLLYEEVNCRGTLILHM